MDLLHITVITNSTYFVITLKLLFGADTINIKVKFEKDSIMDCTPKLQPNLKLQPKPVPPPPLDTALHICIDSKLINISNSQVLNKFKFDILKT